MPRRILPPTVKAGERVTLNRAQLDELARVSNLSWTPAQEAELEELCAEYSILRKFEEASAGPSTVTEILDDLQHQLRDLISSLSNLLGSPRPGREQRGPDTPEYMEPPQYHHAHMEIDDHLENGRPGGTCSVATMLEHNTNLLDAVNRAQNDHKLIFGSPGRPLTNEGLRLFIWKLADLFENANGTATAPYQGILEKPDSPFSRWVMQLNTYLPRKIRAKESLLPDLVREVCRVRREKGRLTKSGR
jgi:hypothetical protein